MCCSAWALNGRCEIKFVNLRGLGHLRSNGFTSDRLGLAFCWAERRKSVGKLAQETKVKRYPVAFIDDDREVLNGI